MNPEEKSSVRPDSLNLFELALKNYRLLAVTFVAAAVLAATLSYTIRPLYRSVAVLYPTTNVVETQSLFGLQADATPLFGDETATEKVLQILRSDHIKNYLTGKYDLMNHYGIKESAKYKYTMLDQKMKRYIVSRKTQYNSIEISVLDADPVTAAAMANDIAGNIDTVFNNIVKEAGSKSYRAIEASYNEQLQRVKALEDSLKMIGLNGYNTAGKGRLKAGSANSNWAASAGSVSPEFLRLINMFESENENLSDIRSRLTGAKILSEQTLPYIHIINEAQVSEKKALPRRAVIVAATAFSALILMLVILALRELVISSGR